MNSNEEYIKRLIQVITEQRNNSQSIIAQLETQLYLTNLELEKLKQTKGVTENDEFK
jgi:pyruvate kinase